MIFIYAAIASSSTVCLERGKDKSDITEGKSTGEKERQDTSRGDEPAPSSPRAAAGRPSTYTRVKPPPGGSRLGPVAANPTCFTCKGGLERFVPRQSSLLLLLCCSIAPSARPRHGTDPRAVPAEPPAPTAPLRTSPDSQTCSPNTILCFLLVTRFKITPRQSAPEALAAGFSPSHRRGRGALA